MRTDSAPGSETQVSLTAIDNQPGRGMSQGRLEGQEFSFRYSSSPEGPCLITPGGTDVCLGRGGAAIALHLHGKYARPGVFALCQHDEPRSATPLVDTGTTAHVAGVRWKTHVELLPGSAPPRSRPEAACLRTLARKLC